MSRVVSDSGPLIHLSEAHALDLLRLTGELSIPHGVEQEVAQQVEAWRTPEWIVVAPLTDRAAQEAAAWQQASLLDRGEAEAIALARQLDADWFLTDDAAARLIARGLNLEVHGSLGVVLWAAVAGHIDRIEAEMRLDGLAHSSLWISAKVLAEAQTALKQLFGS